MQVTDMLNVLGIEYYTGVPDSQLSPLCHYLAAYYGHCSNQHMIAANEGNAVALAAGYYLSTGKPALVYMQNSGIGNAINPIASLMDTHVYGIPAVYVIGWRGQPKVHDEPQHVYQGMITEKLLEVMNIEYMTLRQDTTVDELTTKWKAWEKVLKQGRSVAILVEKNAITGSTTCKNFNQYTLTREEAIQSITMMAEGDMLVSTTGKASRELFEIRENQLQGHGYDFLTVGSMGHSSSIALAIAQQNPSKTIWCIDGDGAMLMHMGAMATIGAYKPNNLIHVLINNLCHETVGGMQTVSNVVDITTLAKSCGYEKIYQVENENELENTLKHIKDEKCLTFLEIKVNTECRSNLGRPTTTPIENRDAFMKHLV